MNRRIASRMAAISPSLTLAVTAKAKAMKAAGEPVISFGAGEPDFNTPANIIAAAKEALDAGQTKYTPSSGLLPLRKAIAEKFRRDNGLEYEPSQIIVSNGAKHSIFNACFALIEPGDEVIIPVPYWLTYPEVVKVCGGVPVYIEGARENKFKFTPAQLEAAITPKTKMLIFNSPSNPTGAVYAEPEVRAIAAVCEKHGIFVLSDEIYEKLCYGGAKPFSIAACSDKMKDLTITVNGVSKTYAMTGWRVGYLAAPADVAKAIDSFQSHATSNACSVSQYAAIAAPRLPRVAGAGDGGRVCAAAGEDAFADRGDRRGVCGGAGRRVLRDAGRRRTVRKIVRRQEDRGFRRLFGRPSGIGEGLDGARRLLRRGRLPAAVLFDVGSGHRRRGWGASRVSWESSRDRRAAQGRRG